MLEKVSRSERLGCNAGRKGVAGVTLDVNIIRSPKQGYLLSHKKDLGPLIFLNGVGRKGLKPN